MSAKSCVVDLRGISGWTKAQRQRKCDLGLVSPTMTANPFVLSTNVGVHTAPGWNEYAGNPPTDLIYQDAKLIAATHPFPDGLPLVLWEGGGNALYGINLASPQAANSYAFALTDRCAWAKGVCLDYFSEPTWLLSQRPGGMPAWVTQAWWEDYDAGLRTLVATIRSLRADWFVYGYQYHMTHATSALSGPFLEDRYTRNLQLTVIRDYVNEIAAARKAPATAILEMRDPTTYGTGQTAAIELACEQYAWFLSKGKDATAVGTI